jgi:ribulose-phosphate 3-epimerase
MTQSSAAIAPSVLTADFARLGDEARILEVDGGIAPATVAGAVRAGARVLVVGSALYRHTDGIAAAISDLHQRVNEALGEPVAAPE